MIRRGGIRGVQADLAAPDPARRLAVGAEQVVPQHQPFAEVDLGVVVVPFVVPAVGLGDAEDVARSLWCETTAFFSCAFSSALSGRAMNWA